MTRARKEKPEKYPVRAARMRMESAAIALYAAGSPPFFNPIQAWHWEAATKAYIEAGRAYGKLAGEALMAMVSATPKRQAGR